MSVKDKIKQLYLNQFHRLMNKNVEMLVSTFYYHKSSVIAKLHYGGNPDEDEGIQFDQEGVLITNKDGYNTPVLTVRFHGTVNKLKIQLTVPNTLNNLGSHLYDEDVISFTTYLKVSQSRRKPGKIFLEVIDPLNWPEVDERSLRKLISSINIGIDNEEIRKVVTGTVVVVVAEPLNFMKSLNSDLFFNNLCHPRYFFDYRSFHMPIIEFLIPRVLNYNSKQE